ncbi:MAG TPA: polysaccharide biosynthesis/export family protein [Candidatus Acidoferrales bacterium]|nr:polysaccharide biosynthesis/export family protein [Candidatus Acidoferrales bacterium]
MLHNKGVFIILGKVCLLAALVILVVASPSFAQQPRLESADQTNSRLRDLARLDDNSGGDYRIGSGDLLAVDVFDVPQLSREVRVSETGYIALPLLPVRVLARGLTGAQLEEKLSELLQSNGLVTHPEVTVTIKEQRSLPITVIGSVKMPQVIQSSRPMSLVEVLSRCGGIADDAGSNVIITRDKFLEESRTNSAPADASLDMPQTLTVNIWDLINKTDPQNNLLVSGGDVVTVPRGGIVYVVGAVTHPGGFVLANDADQMTTFKALALAQGTLSTAKPNEAVILRKDPVTGKNQEIPVDLRKVMQRKGGDTKLVANDILFVPDSAGKHALHRTGDILLTLTSGVALLRLGAL